MNPLDLVKLTALMRRTHGSAQLRIGLIDGPVVTEHPDLAGERFQNISTKANSRCGDAGDMACLHGTFVAGILSAKRGSVAPAICPACTLLLRPIFLAVKASNGVMPSATPEELAAAIGDCIDAGAQILNISAAVARTSITTELALAEALDQAARRGVIVIVAAGNQGTVGGSAITSHPWVVPVVGYTLQGRPMNQSNLGSAIGRRGLGGPGEGVTSIGVNGKPLTLGGTSVAAPFVTGAIALLWSQFPAATAAWIKSAALEASVPRRTTVVPPLLDAWAAYQAMRR